MKITKSKKRIFLILLIFIAAFLVWRFVRPLNIFIVEEKFEKPIHVSIPEGLGSLSARECGNCHTTFYEEWSKSMHKMAWLDPYFQADFTHDGSKQICLNCHSPLENQQAHLVLGFKDKAKFKPILKPNPDYDPHLRDEGVTCAVCHVRDGKIVGPLDIKNAPHPIIVDPQMGHLANPCIRCHVASGKRWDTFYRISPCGTVMEIAESEQAPHCTGCHMPGTNRPLVRGMEIRPVRKHLFWGGHHPAMVMRALMVTYNQTSQGKNHQFEFNLTNVGTVHYLPTGLPDRHLTLELKLLDNNDRVMKEEIFTMKRYILWRPFIIDLYDTRLPFKTPKFFSLDINQNKDNQPSILDITVRYHLLDEKRRKKINYNNTEPISYPIYEERILLNN
jgi:hypothetical protein